MALYKTLCPKCERKLMLPKMAGHVRCPKCAHRFLANGTAESYPVAAAANVTVPEFAQPTSIIPPVADASPNGQLSEPPVETETLATEDNAWSPTAVVAIGTGGALLLGLGVWLVVFCLGRPATPDEMPPDPFVQLPAPNPGKLPGVTAAAGQIVLATAKSDLTPVPKLHAKLAPLTGAVKPAPVTNHAGVDQAKIDAAIQKGAVFLAASYKQNGFVGAQALAGLTLLHCGRANADPAIVDIAGLVRNRAPTLTQTYELALCIMFLDRLGDPADRPLIRAIALQLIAGQGIMGGWNYGCQALNDSQRQQLLTMLETRSSPPPSPPSKGGAGGVPDRTPAKQPTFGVRSAVVPSNMADLPVFQYRAGTLLQLKPHGHEDNSLTQFAILALWAAQKHGIPAQRALEFAEARFRSSQAADGSWGYMWTPTLSAHNPDSMTCAGLLGLAVGRGTHAVSKEANPQQGDAAIEKALRFVGQRIGNLGGSVGQRGKIVGAASLGDLYYLWTLERAAVAYGLQTIGGKDWYAWGAPIIVNQQNANGSWSEAHGPIPDTCFALLFLKRANVALDLTVRLQDLALSKQIGERTRNDPAQRQAFDPFDRRPDLDQFQREAAGFARGRTGEPLR